MFNGEPSSSAFFPISSFTSFQFQYLLYSYLLLDDLAEKTQKNITIHEIDPDAMQQLVNYAYTGDMMITEDNVQAREICDQKLSVLSAC